MTELEPEWIGQVRDVLETLNQGVIITDECPRVVYTNAVFRDMVGRSDDELVGRYVQDLFPPEDVPWLLDRIALGQMQGQDRFEFYLPKVAGDCLPVVISAREPEDPDGRVFAIVTFIDITEQKTSEMDLRRANLLLEAQERALEEDLLLAARIQQSLAPKSLTWCVAADGGNEIATDEPISSYRETGHPPDWSIDFEPGEYEARGRVPILYLFEPVAKEFQCVIGLRLREVVRG